MPTTIIPHPYQTMVSKISKPNATMASCDNCTSNFDYQTDRRHQCDRGFLVQVQYMSRVPIRRQLVYLNSSGL